MDDNQLRHLSAYLEKHGCKLATAESCTAGLVAAVLGGCPGCGKWLECGFVTYSPDAKHRLLNVSYEIIETYGLTSEMVAREMALGALHHSNANIAISNTGVAGSENGDDGTPAGTLCFAWGFRNDGGILMHSETKLYHNERNEIREAAADYSLSRVIYYNELNKK